MEDDTWPFDENTRLQLKKMFDERREADQKAADAFWDSLSYEDRCNAFHAVVQRIHKGDIVDQGSYRWVLYDVFRFEADMYSRAMDCGYMDIHNSFWDKRT